MLRALHGITGRHAHVFPGRDDRAKMMQQWADMLDTWQKGNDKVTPIRHQAAA